MRGKRFTQVFLRPWFMTLTSQPEANVRGLSRQVGTGQKIGYRWIGAPAS